MKKTIIYIALVSFFAAGLFQSCEDEDTIRFNIEEFSRGFLPFFDWADGSNEGFNPDDLANSTVTVLVDLRAQETEKLVGNASNVNTIDIQAVYDNILSPLAIPDTAIVASVSSWPSEVTLTPQDMVDAFDSISSINDITAGDIFTLSQIITLKDGSVIDGIMDKDTIAIYDSAGNSLGNLNYYTYDNDLRINESEQNVYDWDIYVNCPNDLAGSYTLTSSGEMGYGWGNPAAIDPDWNSEMQVTLTNAGLGMYECDACMGGAMVDTYGQYGSLRVGTFIVLCDNSVDNVSITDGFNFIQYTGTYNPDNGVITINWANPWGDNGTSVYTPN